MRILTPEPVAIGNDRSGRLEFARWIASPRNPLTARVMVNRVWSHLMGRGIVATVDDFGKLGAAPTHPQLLDRLAMDFIADGWSVKKLIRTIVLSRAYQLSSMSPGSPIPPSRLEQEQALWCRRTPRRLDAEAARDAILSLTGRLRFERPQFGSTLHVPGSASWNDPTKYKVADENPPYRSVYLPILRGNIVDHLSLFDFGDSVTTRGKRDVTTTAPQSLFLMNSPWMLDQSEALARKVIQDSSDDRQRLHEIYQRVLLRSPDSKEAETALADLAELTKLCSATHEDPELGAWTAYCQALLSSGEFRFVR
jgi:hypothetical protein